MRYLSLFSGIGGFEIGINKAHENSIGHSVQESASATLPDISPNDSGLRKWGQQDAVCVGYSEIDQYATQIYQRHFPDHKNYGDITTINASELPDFDFLCGGFPCQAFSIAGKRRGFDDTRGTLFFEIARLIQAKQPRLLLLENVKGLLSHDEGNTFRTIIAALDELGYDLQWQVLNSKNHGVPQNRERVFIVGHLRGTPRPEVFPFYGADGEDTQSDHGSETAVFPTIRATHYKSGDNQPVIHQLNQPTHSNDRVYGEGGISPTLNTMQGGNRQPFVVCDSGLSREKQIRTDVLPPLRAGRGADRADTFAVNGIRRLTPTECERLQGFPDGWTDGVSDTQRYKCLGNAVTTNVIQAIVEKLI